MRCVFDTNVLVSALLLAESIPRRAFEHALGHERVLISWVTLAELHEVLSRKHFRKYVDEEDVRRFIAALTREAEWVEVTRRITRVAHTLSFMYAPHEHEQLHGPPARFLAAHGIRSIVRTDSSPR